MILKLILVNLFQEQNAPEWRQQEQVLKMFVSLPKEILYQN